MMVHVIQTKYGYAQHTKLTLLSLQALVPYEIACVIEMYGCLDKMLN